MPRQKSTHVDDPRAVGRRLRGARERAGLSQRQLAFPGCSAAYISRLEAGQRVPSLQLLRKLAAKLNADEQYLATGVEVVEQVTGRKMQVWMGECHVHAGIGPAEIREALDANPGLAVVDSLIVPRRDQFGFVISETDFRLTGFASAHFDGSEDTTVELGLSPGGQSFDAIADLGARPQAVDPEAAGRAPAAGSRGNGGRGSAPRASRRSRAGAWRRRIEADAAAASSRRAG